MCDCPDCRAQIEYLESVIQSLTGEDKPLLAGLTRIESSIVRRLERANGEVVSHDRLIAATQWSTSDPVQFSTLQARIYTIKRKRPDIKKRLFTEYGWGYGLRPRVHDFEVE